MNKLKLRFRLLALLLTLLTLTGCLLTFQSLGVYAEEGASSESNTNDQENVGNTNEDVVALEVPVSPPETEFVTDSTFGKTNAELAAELLANGYGTAEMKLATMKKMATVGDLSIYVYAPSGEVAIYNNKTKQILFSNPYDVSDPTHNPADLVKYQLLSQVTLSYIDNHNNTATMNSFSDAALNGQIRVRPLKGGVRVEYALGRESVKRLIPELIRRERFEEMIMNPIKEQIRTGVYPGSIKYPDPEAFIEILFPENIRNPRYYALDSFHDILKESALEVDCGTKINAYYQGTVIEKQWKAYQGAADTEKAAMLEKVNEMYRTTISEKSPQKTNWMEIYIKSYTSYTYEDLLEDETWLGKQNTDIITTPYFTFGVEYYLNQDSSFSIRLAAGGLSYDENAFTVTELKLVPYMGAGRRSGSEGDNIYEGFNFIPDGSGSIIRVNDVKSMSSYSLTTEIYGPDFAYHTINTSSLKKEAARYPVYGIVGGIKPLYNYLDENGVHSIYADGFIYEKTITQGNISGFVAIIESGEALATITSDFQSNHIYNSVQLSLNPRPSDTYNLRDTSSIAVDSPITVALDNKYLESYRVRYYMLQDNYEASQRTDKSTKYEATYSGMMNLYRDYLVGQGVLTDVEDANKKEQIPLYMETLGLTTVQSNFLGIPTYVKTPLTTFSDIKEITEQLAAQGINNVNYRLNGFMNGTISSYTMPYKIKFNSKLGGQKGYLDLLQYAADKDIEIFPNVDFAYANGHSSFLGFSTDGLNLKKHAAKTIDGRYTLKREYSPVTQTVVNINGWGLVISPSTFSHFYDKFAKNFGKIVDTKTIGLSVGTLGSDLNSDFDRKDPYNREESKVFTIETLKKVSQDFGTVMIDGGNVYSLPYADHILNMSLQSSNYRQSSASVPFYQMVIHGYKSYAGSPTNMSSSLDAEILKIIETGASPYFMLAYQNSETVKENYAFSQYYSLNYAFWLKDLILTYNELNDALASVQYAKYLSHDYTNLGIRVADYEDISLQVKQLDAQIEAKRKYIAYLQNELDKLDTIIANIQKSIGELQAQQGELLKDVLAALAGAIEVDDQAKAVLAEKTGALNEINAQIAEINAAINAIKAPLENAQTAKTAADNNLTAKQNELITTGNALTAANALPDTDPNKASEIAAAQTAYDLAAAAVAEAQAQASQAAQAVIDEQAIYESKASEIATLEGQIAAKQPFKEAAEEARQAAATAQGLTAAAVIAENANKSRIESSAAYTTVATLIKGYNDSMTNVKRWREGDFGTGGLLQRVNMAIEGSGANYGDLSLDPGGSIPSLKALLIKKENIALTTAIQYRDRAIVEESSAKKAYDRAVEAVRILGEINASANEIYAAEKNLAEVELAYQIASANLVKYNQEYQTVYESFGEKAAHEVAVATTLYDVSGNILKNNYTIEFGSVAIVKYDNGDVFIINNNSFDVKILYNKEWYYVNGFSYYKFSTNGGK